MTRTLSMGLGLSSKVITWYDRNPVARPQNYSAGAVGPHSVTDRWTYTVPTGKKAFLEAAFAYLIRDSAATTAGEAHCFIALIIGGVTVVLNDATVFNAAMGAFGEMELTQFGVLGPGDQIIARTSDASTGGSFYYRIAAKITEFDA